ncbi:MAG: cysteine--tRNA ligase [Candidatus Niyogibacteria bacterium]|nr:cysteine--tRNA ligase [Candidatus Niyogibacteria bacterium]
MALRLYNYLTRQIEEFKPRDSGTVGFYTCGPTVYDSVHIGNLRTYIFEDVLKRALKAEGYTVRHVMNITDVDDKIIERAAKLGKPIGELAREYEDKFREDLRALNIEDADTYPRATEYIEEMQALIGRLLLRGYAYEKEGSVYFDISKFSDYGALSRLDKQQLKAGARIDIDEYAKDAAQDFVLWKAKKDDEPFWDSPWGDGRPGWHIECSAMSTKELDQPFDIHAGGIDLLFPHHENEIAQSVAADPEGHPLARFFVEGELLTVDGKKMSKSLGNILTLDDLAAKKFSPLAFRYFVFNAHYRSPLNFTWEALHSATIGFAGIKNGVLDAKENKRDDRSDFREQFMESIADDLNTSFAVGMLHAHRDRLSYDDFMWADRILGLGLGSTKPIPDDVQQLEKERARARKEENWQKADELREEIQKRGWDVEDHGGGSVLKPHD